MGQSVEYLNSLSWIGTIASGLAIIVFFQSLQQRPILPVLLVLGFQAYIAISSLWSVVAADTLYAVAKSVIYICAAAEICRRLSLRRLFHALAWGIGIIAIGSVWLMVTDPLNSVSVGASGWRGMFAHKNGLGSFCLFSVTIFLPFCFLGFGKTRAISKYLVAFLLLLCFIAGSKTSFFISTAMVIFSSSFIRSKFLNDLHKKFISLFIALLCISMILTPLTYVLIDKYDVTFTGRTEIWARLADLIGSHLFLGAGGLSASLDNLLLMQVADSVSIDSSIVTILVNLGLVGLTFYGAVIWSFLEHFYRSGAPLALFGLFAMVAYICSGLFESSAALAASYPTLAIVILASMAPLAARIRAGRLFALCAALLPCCMTKHQALERLRGASLPRLRAPRPQSVRPWPRSYRPGPFCARHWRGWCGAHRPAAAPPPQRHRRWHHPIA